MSNLIRDFIFDGDDKDQIKIFRRIFAVTLSIAFIVIVLISAYNIRQAKIKSLNEKLANSILNSLNHNDKTDWQVLLEEQSKNLPLADLGKLRLAFLNLQQGDVPKAVQMLQDINSKSSIVNNYIKTTLIAIYLDYKNLIETKTVENYISDLSVSGTPFYYTGKIFQSLYLIDQNDFNSAKNILEAILSDENTPKSIRMQAIALMKKARHN